jgi:hypothetical protein
VINLICRICHRNIIEVSDGDLRNEYAEQSDCLGMESLTENQQLLVEGSICEDCYEELDNM